MKLQCRHSEQEFVIYLFLFCQRCINFFLIKTYFHLLCFIILTTTIYFKFKFCMDFQPFNRCTLSKLHINMSNNKKYIHKFDYEMNITTYNKKSIKTKLTNKNQ